MIKINSAVIIDYDDIDNFISSEILERYGVKDIHVFKKTQEALVFLKETDLRFNLILIGNRTPLFNGFEFIDEYYKLRLNKKHDKLILLSAFFSPEELANIREKNIKYLIKPFDANDFF